MAGIAFSAGQSMIRPGVYTRYVQSASPLYAGTSDGIVGCAFSAHWGPLGEVVELSGLKQAACIFGGDGGIFRQIFSGGANTVYAVRAGTGGTPAECTLMDTEGAAAVSITALYAGVRGLSYELCAAQGGMRALILREDGAELERTVFKAGEGEAAALIAAGGASKYVRFGLAPDCSGNEELATVTETAMTAGTDPRIDADAYGAALDCLTAYAWNCVCVDDCSKEVRAELSVYMKRAADDGHMGFGVAGEGTDTAIDARISHAAALNSHALVYVGGGWYEDDELIDGWRAAVNRIPSRGQ